MILSVKKVTPNVLTALRLLAVPFTLLAILRDHLVLAFCLFSFAAITDYIDGFLARLWGVESRFGRIFDPIADKTLLMGSYITLAYMGHIPIWLMYLVVGRDILILLAGLVVYLFNLPVRLTPISISKINTFFQLLFVCLVLLLDMGIYQIMTPDLYHPMMWVLVYTTAFTTALSGVEYMWYFAQTNLRSLFRSQK
jgi:cardiolipin synthase